MIVGPLAELEEEMMTADGFDDAIMGMCVQFGAEPLVAYDYEKCISILIERDDLTRTEAIDYIQFNVIGAYVGLNTPVFIMT